MNFAIGRSISISHGFISAPSYAKSIGCQIFQIFLGAPMRVQNKKKNEKDLIKFGKELVKQKIKMVIHGSYTINLAHPVDSDKYQKSVKALVQDLNSSSLIGPECLGVIIHMGKNVAENNISDEEAMDNYVTGLEEALKVTPVDTTIILETGASQGHEIASQIDGLAEIYNKLKKSSRKRVYFCVDTCHIWASGYDISSRVGIKNFFKEFDENIGIDKIICMHFNDSKTDLNSHVDRHEDLGYGFIKEKGLKIFAQYSKKYDIPIIMETPLDSVNPKTNQDITFAEELAKVKSWIK